MGTRLTLSSNHRQKELLRTARGIVLPKTRMLKMYIPSAFRVDDSKQLFEFIDTNGFAVLVSPVDHGPPVATHLPLMLAERDGKVLLVGHLARANPQWQSADQRPVLAIFHGPHSFISAEWYGRRNVVPTWNYVAVHATGILHLVTDRDRLRQIVEDLTRKYESAIVSTPPVEEVSAANPSSIAPWTLSSVDADFLEGMLNGIVGFEIEVDQIEGSWKLNQHHDEDRRQRVIHALTARATEQDLSIAQLMQDR